MSLEEACKREVAELHEFIQNWYNGEVPEDEPTFERFSGVMAPEFELIFPDGEVYAREKIMLLVQYGHGSAHRRENPGPMRIWVDAHRHRHTCGETAVVTYEEWQDRTGEPRARISSAVFRAAPDTPNGVQWLHVHETWK